MFCESLLNYRLSLLHLVGICLQHTVNCFNRYNELNKLHFGQQQKMDSFSTEIADDYPGRETYVKELNQLFGHRDHLFPPSVFVCGASGTGKTSVLLKFFEHVSITYAYIDCIENYTSKVFYETVINSLHGHKLSSSNNFQNYAHCDSAEDFIDALAALDTKKSFAIVLKNFNRLHDMDVNVLPILMRLDTLAPALNISCLIIGSKSKKNHIAKLGLIPTIDLHCEQYSKADLLKILLVQIEYMKQTMNNIIDESHASAEIKKQQTNILQQLDDDFFVGYLNMFMDTFYSICRNAKELLYLSNANFPIYCRPVINGEIRSNDLRKLYKNMELPFKSAINSIYCRVEQNALQPNNVSIVTQQHSPFFFFISHATHLTQYFCLLCRIMAEPR